MEGISDVVNVLGVDTADTDSTILSHVDSILSSQLVHDLLGEASVAEHANLVLNVLPAVRAASVLQLLHDSVPHGHHAARHDLQLSVPLCGQLLV